MRGKYFFWIDIVEYPEGAIEYVNCPECLDGQILVTPNVDIAC